MSASGPSGPLVFVLFFNSFRNAIDVKQLGSKADPSFCRTCSRIKLLAKSLANKEINILASKRMVLICIDIRPEIFPEKIGTKIAKFKIHEKNF